MINYNYYIGNIFYTEDIEDLKYIIKHYFKYLDNIYLILRELDKKYNINIGLVFDEDKKEFSTGINIKDYVNKLSYFILENIDGSANIGKNIVYADSQVLEVIDKILIDNFFITILIQNKDISNEMIVALEDTRIKDEDNNLIPFDIVVAAISSPAFQKRQKELDMICDYEN